MKQFICLSGLPRSGSTLLSALLHQNPEIHAEGNSAVCQLMADVLQSCETTSNEQLRANYRYDTQYHLMSQIRHIYYRNTTRPIIVDKCRSWSLQGNQEMVRSYITDTPKTIVLTRPIDEIVSSFAALYERNGKKFDEGALLREGSEPLMRSLAGVTYAKQANKGEFLFITYDELTSDTGAVLDSIYGFIGAERYAHNLDYIVNEMPEDDSVYGLSGMHEVRTTVGKRLVG
jgi:sulfotransferase